MMDVPVECAGKSDPGRDPDKQVNEDQHRVGKTRFGLLALVCDGMGGHAGGKEASNVASATVFAEVEAAAADATPASAIKRAIEIANRKVYALGESSAHGRPGSTIVAMLFHAGGAEIAHVGDSRIYLVRGVECMQVTRDHSAVQQMVDAGVLTAEQAKVHPEANKITRALGIEAEVDVELRPHAFSYAAGDTFVLCSDGLSDLLEPEDFVRLVGGVPLQQAAGQLIDLANARGGHDNITALLARAKGASYASSELRTQLMQKVPAASAGVAKTQIGLPIAAAGIAVAKPASLPRAPRTSPRVRGTPALVLGLTAAAVVVWILGGLLYLELRERGGHHNVTPPLPSVIVSVAPPTKGAASLDPSARPAAVGKDDDEGAAAGALREKLLPWGPPSGFRQRAPRPSASK